MLKTHTCGELTLEHVGQQVTLAGWVNRRRDHGGLIFIDLRDRFGITQVTIDSERATQAHGMAIQVRSEYVVQVHGRGAQTTGGLREPESGHRRNRGHRRRGRPSSTPPSTPPFYISGSEPTTSTRRCA